MADQWLLPEFVFDGQSLLDQTAVCIIDGKISSLMPTSSAPKDARKIDGVLSPGFVDLQVNGGGGVFFNTSRSADGISAIAAAHRQFGTTAILPTVITDTPEALAEAVDAAIDAKGRQGVLGIHIEGPHISSPRRGTHSPELVRPMDEQTIQHVARLRDHKIPVMITVAPESTTNDQISRLAELGAIVSIGHSDVTADVATAAFDAGVSCATHLFNAMSPMLNRAPGVTGAVINSDIAAGLIVDGIHVADEMIALAMRARPEKDRMFIVSDAMPTVGGPDHFDLYDMSVKLVDGKLVNSEGSLAGAHLTQAEGLYRLVNVIGANKSEALRMAITVPAMLMGRADLASIIGQSTSDLIMLSSDLEFQSIFAL